MSAPARWTRFERLDKERGWLAAAVNIRWEHAKETAEVEPGEIEVACVPNAQAALAPEMEEALREILRPVDTESESSVCVSRAAWIRADALLARLDSEG